MHWSISDGAIVCARAFDVLASFKLFYWAFTRYDRRTDRSIRLVCPTIVSCKRFVIRPVGQMVGWIKHVWFRPTADPTVVWTLGLRPTGRTDGQSDDQSRCSVGGTCSLRHS